MSKTVENTNLLLKFVSNKFENDELDNDSLIQLIELAGSYLNIQTIANYAKEVGKDYNCIKKSALTKVELFGVKFVIDNE